MVDQSLIPNTKPGAMLGKVHNGGKEMKGLTRRDMIAIEAMKALVSDRNAIHEFIGISRIDNCDWKDYLAYEAYAIADAMLKEREKKEGE